MLTYRRNKLAKTNKWEVLGMPLSMARAGEVNKIQRIKGKDEIRRFLETLGFVEGSAVTVISEINGNVIVNIKNSRVAISREMAGKIII